MRIVLAGATALLLIAAGVVEARAATVEGQVRHPVEAGPELAAGTLAYVPVHGRHAVPLRIASGGATRELARLDAAPKPEDSSHYSRSVLAALDASETALVARLTTFFSHPDTRPLRLAVQTFAGPLAGPVSPRSTACELSSFQAVPDLGADGPLVATTGPDCGDESVVNVLTGARRVFATAARGDVQVAGGLTAWLEPAGPDPPPPNQPSAEGVIAVVIDGSGQELLRSGASGALLSSADLALDASGTVAVHGRLSENQRLDPVVATASPADPVLRRVPMPRNTASVLGARLAAGRLAVLRTVKNRHRLTGGVITVMSSRGEGARTVLRGVDASRDFDFDGRQVAASVRGCDRVLLVRQPIAARDVRAPTGRNCRLGLAARPQLTRRGLRIELSCDGFETLCAPTGLVARLGRPTGPVLAKPKRDSLLDNTFTLRLSSAARQLLESHPRPSVFLTARVSDYADDRRAPRRTIVATVRH